MKIEIQKVPLEQIEHFRRQFLLENSFQFTYDKCHIYGWADTYIFFIDSITIGYGSVWGSDNRQDRDSIFEFYVIQPYRLYASKIFSELVASSNAIYIECQSNDTYLTAMLYEFANNIQAEAILFEDHFTSNLSIPDVIFRKVTEQDAMDGDDSDYILEHNEQIVATGGMLLNYNFPYADLYMHVRDPFRNKGYGSFIVQELKIEAYRMGRVPAARCNIANLVSKATLQKAGFTVCGHRLKGHIKQS